MKTTTRPASYQIKAENPRIPFGGMVKFRVRATYERDADGNECADIETIHAEVTKILAHHRPSSGLWSYSVTYRGETFDHGDVSV